MNVLRRLPILGPSKSVRAFATTIEDYKITWNRPKKVYKTDPEKSGDRGKNPEVSTTDLVPYYDRSIELKDADDIVKKVFTLGFSYRSDTVALQREKMLALVKRHNLDRGSPEAKIAAMTSEILHLQEVRVEQPRNKKLRLFLAELIDKRNKMLRHLRNWDYKRFEWIIEKLDIVYRPKPETLKKPTRRETLTLLTEEYCDKLIKQKLDAYRAELEHQQKEFFREKVLVLENIRKDEEELGLTPTVTLEDIENARQRAQALSTV